MAHIMDVLEERGFIKQVMHEEELRERLAQGPMTFYVGFDPTADSLHVGHFIPIMAMAHMQRAGHRPIALVGGGTCMIGDPSGKADMRKMLSVEQIDSNVAKIKKQLQRFIDFDNGAKLVNNADWLRNLNYIEFLREIGVHFNVNKMLAADCFKIRMERDTGLTFLEFNYMLMQGYDFYRLHQDYGCELQCGGDDQWSNMIAGADLIRKKDQEPAFAITFALLANSQGQKMGKTVAGALWLDEEKTSPYDFYQYWRNVEDDMVEKCLALLTFLPMDEVRRLGALEGAKINEAKKILAFEVTKIVHGEEKALAAQKSAEALFGAGTEGEAPVYELAADEAKNMRIVDVLAAAGLAKSKSEARKLVEQGAVLIDGEKVTSIDFVPDRQEYLLRRGKKQYKKIIVK
ncbi:MAG: tyrosine--tRNA ligase [Clostridia bacterium]|nr:tyrosine--tRNA ligase [Clostridia bacterium]